MGKPLPWLSKQAPTSSSPAQPRSQAVQPVTATTSASSAAADEKAPVHKLDPRKHGREIVNGASEYFGALAAKAYHRTGMYQRGLSGPAPDRVLVHPRCFHRKSLAEAELLIMGRFRLPGGDATARDGSPFFIKPPSELWLESLHSFHWLRHFDADGSEPVQEHLRQLIAHWVRAYGSWNEVAWRPHVLARRLMTWASFGRLILVNADVLFRSRVLLSMARQTRHLAKTGRKAVPGLPRMTAAVGLAQAGVFMPDGEAHLNKGLHFLAEEIGDQILPDGSHISRNPETLFAIASDLLSLIDAMVQRDLIVPTTIRRALDRMMPMIRFMRHGDGRLALFNGGSEGVEGWAETLLSYDTGRSSLAQDTTHGGYHRIACGSTLLIADVGMAPPPRLSTGAHAGCLSFEVSAEGERIIVNCGTSLLKGPDWAHAMRATAAHSTVTVADTSSAHVVCGKWMKRFLGARLVDGPTLVEGRRHESETGIHIETNHDGYVAPFGLVHDRRLFVSHDGGDIRGEDTLVPPGADAASWRFAARFHLHPTVKATRMADGKAVVLALPSGVTWRFGCDAPLDLADSVYLGAGDAIRKTTQIVVSGVTGNEPVTVKWALKKIGAASPVN